MCPHYYQFPDTVDPQIRASEGCSVILATGEEILSGLHIEQSLSACEGLGRYHRRDLYFVHKKLLKQYGGSA